MSQKLVPTIGLQPVPVFDGLTGGTDSDGTETVRWGLRGDIDTGGIRHRLWIHKRQALIDFSWTSLESVKIHRASNLIAHWTFLKCESPVKNLTGRQRVKINFGQKLKPG
ncbi:hypothetical protein B0H13DRAFT_1910318 [Mycena leptocephala]|nr:hypothetical protein B0H13DRAFT_1910318 [Mycena leptocephala]